MSMDWVGILFFRGPLVFHGWFGMDDRYGYKGGHVRMA